MIPVTNYLKKNNQKQVNMNYCSSISGWTTRSLTRGLLLLQNVSGEIEAHLTRCLKETFESYVRLDFVLARDLADKGIKFATKNEELLTPTARKCWAHLLYWKGVTQVSFIGIWTHVL